MNRTQKQAFVEGFQSKVVDAPLLMLADFRGATVEESDGFRRKLEKAGVDFQVVKNTLAKRAVEGTDKEPLAVMFSGMTGVVISGDDPVAAARAVKDAMGKESKIVVKGAILEGSVLEAAAALGVADMASKEEMLATLLRTMQEAPRQVLGVLSGPGRDLVYLLKNFETKLAETQGNE